METIWEIKILSESLQGVINCVEKKLYNIDSSSYVSSWLPEALVHRSGLVGRSRLVVNIVQVKFLRSWRFSWTRIAYTLCISRTTLWRRLKEAGTDSRFLEDCNVEVTVPEINVPLIAEEMQTLKENVNPLDQSSDYGTERHVS